MTATRINARAVLAVAGGAVVIVGEQGDRLAFTPELAERLADHLHQFAAHARRLPHTPPAELDAVLRTVLAKSGPLH